jgi:ABC-type multidrug transport system ATPase subunit
MRTFAAEVEQLVRKFKQTKPAENGNRNGQPAKQAGLVGPRPALHGVAAVDGVRFAIAPGEVCGLRGPNGAGQSTTLRLLGTRLEPSGGAARAGGHDVMKQGPLMRQRGTLGQH